MRISIGQRLFVSVLLAILGVVATAIVLMRQNVTRSVGEYALNIELDRLDELSRALAGRHAASAGWSFLPAGADARRGWIAREMRRLDRVRNGGDGALPMALIAPPAPPVGTGIQAPPLPPPLPAPPDAPGAPGIERRITLLDATGAYLAGQPLASGPAARRPILQGTTLAGYLVVSQPPRPGDALASAFLAQLSSSLWVIGAASIVLSAIAAMLLAANFRKPIERLAQGARALADGRFETRLQQDRGDELGDLAASFNLLAARLDAMEDERRAWIADTSHELRTPLSVLRAQLEAIQDGVRSADMATVASMLRQVLSLNTLIDDLYALARLDVGVPDYTFAPLDLLALARRPVAGIRCQICGGWRADRDRREWRGPRDGRCAGAAPGAVQPAGKLLPLHGKRRGGAGARQRRCAHRDVDRRRQRAGCRAGRPGAPRPALLPGRWFTQPRARWRRTRTGAVAAHRRTARRPAVLRTFTAGRPARHRQLAQGACMSARVMIVEDEPELAALVADYARAAGFGAEIFNDGAQALAAALARPPDVLVLDLMLPGLDGLSVCRTLRAAPASATLPIIMVTAKVEEIDRLLGLESGADDYLCKPFSPRELVARIKALLRRSGGFAQAPVLTVDDAGQRVLVHGQPIDLTPTEYALLAGMARHPGQVFSRARLLDLAAQDKLDTSDRAIDSHIKNLRRKLGAALPDAEPITSLYGLGYRLDL